jgi:6-pyruvoyltetrahydropterin/6-carboxytetrahydropterin synthase
MTHYSTKQYGHDIGISACFRQWRAEHSHCKYLHGYALALKFIFGADELDARNWVADFGALKPLRAQLENLFDHKTVVANDDPLLNSFIEMEKKGMMQLTIVEAVGCEKFAQIAFDLADEWLHANRLSPRVKIISCEVKEHGANSAIFSR